MKLLSPKYACCKLLSCSIPDSPLIPLWLAFKYVIWSNDIALAIAELGNNEFSKDISDINADIGNSLSDLSDNIAHQTTIENLLLDQRNAISAVSIDEEVADLMQFQRSFQASSRVLNTLDKMLELVVMGLIK